MTYKKTEPKANFSDIEHSVLEFWRKDDTFHKSLEKTKMGEQFNFYDVIYQLPLLVAGILIIWPGNIPLLKPSFVVVPFDQ